MAGLFGISVDPTVYAGKNFGSDLFVGTFYQQHLGEQFAGLSSIGKQGIVVRTRRGLLRANFGGDMNRFSGTEAIGCCGCAPQPFRFEGRLGIMSLAMTGNVLNYAELKAELNAQLERGDEIEVVAKLIVQKCTIIEGLRYAAQKIKGAVTLLLLTEAGLYCFYGPDGRWPLMLAKKDGAVAVASESSSFNNNGFTYFADLNPGDIVLLKNGGISRSKEMPCEPRICSFLWVYTNYVASSTNGIPSSRVRMRLGAALAERDIEKGFIPHVVIPIPDSGRFHALGYHWEFVKALMQGTIDRAPMYFEPLVKYPYAGRSFTPQTQAERDQEALMKILPIGETIEGFVQEYFDGLLELFGLSSPEDLDLVTLDDSIVRATQFLCNLIPKLRSIGFRRIHARVSNPELLSQCPWGKTTRKGELIALQIPNVVARAEHIGLTSLVYNTIPELVKAIGLPASKLCLDCSRVEA